MSAEHSGPDLPEGSAPEEPAAPDQDELTPEEVEQHIAEAERLHQDLTARLDTTAQD